MLCGQGNDVLYGGAGNDGVYGNEGERSCCGAARAMTQMYGQTGDDYLNRAETAAIQR
jgi:Ca2+-binding RTX toxin-like protein